MQQNLEIYTVPVGATMREEFCQELKQMGFGTGVLILPTGLLQEQVKEEYNVAVSGFDTLANKILNLNGFAYLEEVNYRSQQLMVKETLEYYAEKGLFQYLAVLKDKKGFVKHMTALLSQLSRSGATADEINTALNSWGRTGNLGIKDKEVALVYKGYRNMLKQGKHFDLEGKYRLALDILRKMEQPKLPWQVIYISDFATLDALQLELLKEIARFCKVKVGMCYEENKGTCKISQNTLDQLKGKGSVIAKDGFSFQRSPVLQALVNSLGCQKLQKLKLENDKSIVLREYKHQQAEIKGVLAEIKQEVLAGASLKDYAVAVYDLNTYTGLRLIADAYGIPLTLPKTEQLLVQPLTEFVLNMLAAVSNNRQGVEAYFTLLSSGLGKLLFTSSLEEMEHLRKKTFFKRRSDAQAAVTAEFKGQEIPALLVQLDAFIINCKPRNTLANYVEEITNFVTNLSLGKELGNLYKQDKLSLTGLQRLLNTEKRLLESLRSLQEDYEKCGWSSENFSLQEFVEFWQEGLKEVSIVFAEGRKDGLLVNNAVQLQGTSFKKVYLLGLREGEFPAGNRENWLYNDKERGELQSLGVDLPNTYSAYAADYCLFAGAVAAAKEQLVLSFYKDEEGEESPYVDEVQNLFSDLLVEMAEERPIASVDEALSQSTNCATPWVEQQVGSLTLQVAQIDQQRAGVYNGTFAEQELLESLKDGSRNYFNASALAKYVSCPFKYLGTQLWQQQAAGEKNEKLDGGTRGNLLHETVAEFVQSYLQGKPDINNRSLLWKKLLDIYESNVEQYQKEGKILANEYWPVESIRLQKILLWWFDYELSEQQQWTDFKPVALEKNFGGQSIHLETEAHEDVYLTGRIDRIDCSEDAVFITDYKSGEAPGNGDFEKGKDLQMAFYLLAAEKLFPGKNILGGNYLSLKKRTRQGGVAWGNTGNANIKINGKKNAPTYTNWQEVREDCESMVLKPVTELYKGRFAVSPQDENSCMYCPLTDICRHSLLPQDKVMENQEEVNQDGNTTADQTTANNN